MGRLLLVVVLLTACGPVVPRAATVTPSPTAASPQSSPSPPSRSPFLAVVGGPKNSSVSLVASDGTVVATAAVDLAPFRMHAMMSWTSASRTRVYYLNGGSEVRFLAPDGTTGTATRIALGAAEQAGFAVSPDDASLAVAVFSYTLASGPPASANYNGMRLYVEDLHGGGHHVDIFSSTTVAEFPIGWTGGRLILAVSHSACCRADPINPYDATSYHVVDPASGTRLASLCDVGDGPEGPIEPVGVACSKLEPDYLHWDGSHFIPPAAVPNPSQYLNALSPDGTRVAVGQPDFSDLGIRIWIFGPSGGRHALKQSGYVLGWLDDNRIVIRQIDSPALSVLELDMQSSSQIATGGSYLGTFPTSLN